jgi:hypothetical protein
MNIPEMQKRIEEINEEQGMTDPFPKFDQPAPPASVGEAVAAAEEAEGEAPPEGEEVEAAPVAEGEEQEEEAAPEGEEAAAEDDDIAWVKQNKGFEVTDPVVAKTLRSQEEMIRRQGTEVGEARKLIEQERQERLAFQAQQEQRQAQSFDPDEAWEDWADEGVQVDPLATIIEAGNAGGPAAAQYALQRWHMHDPAAAVAFQVEAQTQIQQQQAEPQVDAEGSWGRVGSRHPDLLDYKTSMEALLEDPETLDRMNALASRDPDAALENLYLQARVGQTDKQRSDALAKANAARAAAVERGAVDATVASATASAGHGEGRPLTEAEQVRANVRAELGLVIPSE